MVEQHGYYLPKQEILGGEPALAQQSQRFYREQLELDPQYAQPYDGVSIFNKPDGTLIVRVSLQNFFNPQLNIHTHDYPYERVSAASSVERVSAPATDCQPRPCAWCGGNICLLPPDGDFLNIRYRGQVMFMPIPTYVAISKCSYCGEVYLGFSEASGVAMAMGGELVWM